jgi:hypothetical protein
MSLWRYLIGVYAVAIKRKQRFYLLAVFLLVGLVGVASFSQSVSGGLTVYQLLSDFQDQPNGGNGWLRILTFKPQSDVVEVETFSPFLNQFQNDADSKFTLSYVLNGSRAFSVIVLPDTQYYSAFHPEIFLNQTRWIVENRAMRNIVFVIHLGDIVDNFGDSAQWYNSKDALNHLAYANIPFSVLPGNHDFVGWEENKLSRFYLVYGPHVFDSVSYYGGSFQDDGFNNYCKFSVEGNSFLVLSLQFNPSYAALDWANGVIEANVDCNVVLATHEYLGSSSRTAIGERVWQKTVMPHAEQVQIVLCGHFNGENSKVGGIISYYPREVLRVDRVPVDL